MAKAVQKLLERYAQFIKFAISGCIVAVVNLSSLYLFTDLLGIWYLTSSFLAYIMSFFVNFFLQKYWTFEDHALEGTTFKIGIFFINSLVNLGLNTVLMYALVDGLHIWYLLAQCVAIGILMLMNYTVYRLYIFRPTKSTPSSPHV